MIKIEQYCANYKEKWDNFIINAKNGHFIFCRNYMDYHSDRFIDHSLMFNSEDGQLLAVLPANIQGRFIYSHQGLTYGGIISDQSMKTNLMLEIVDALIQYLKKIKVNKLIYKHIPYSYHVVPSQEDFYALYYRGARLYRVDIASTIHLQDKLKFSSGRKDGIRKALKTNLKVIKSNDFKSFYSILTARLESKYNTNPIHSLFEIELLANRFLDNISLYGALNENNELLAGVLIFEMNHWAHVQYIASSEQGRSNGALDLIFNKLINEIYANKKFFNFGISSESEGKILNSGLIAQKEGFGARAIVHNILELNI